MTSPSAAATNQDLSPAPTSPVEDTVQLFDIALDALKLWPPFYGASILGWPNSWYPSDHSFSEYRIISPWHLWRSLRFLATVTVPAMPHRPPSLGPPAINRFFWRPTTILQRPDHNGCYTTFPEEAWIFINGVATNDEVAQMNAAYLSYLFHRPLTLIQNASDSLLLDLVECARGKAQHKAREAGTKAFPVVYDALKDPHKERVVLIAHSQGTIITAVVLDLLAQKGPQPAPPAEAIMGFAPPEPIYADDEQLDLDDFEPLSEQELRKLEVYCFANCANTMRYVLPASDNYGPLPWIESFGNEHDLVARLGMLAPHGADYGVHIDGPRYMRVGGWGHFLNAHYLVDVERKQRHGRRHGGNGTCDPYILLDAGDYPANMTPRLFAYINGGTPPPRTG